MNGSPPRLPASASPFGPALRGRDVARAILLGLALFGAAFLALRELAAGVTTVGERINYLLGYFAAWCFSWLAAIWFVFVRGRGMSFADLGYTIPPRMWAGRGVMFAFAALPIAYGLLALLRPVLDIKSGATLQQYFGGPDFTLIHAATILLYGGFLVPLAEELLFRGLIFRWLRQRLDFWPAAVISGSAFGLAHVRFDQMVIAGLLGLPLAWLYERSRSLAPAILMHQTYNSLVLMLTFAVVWLPPSGG
jgi:membrane protease YdiL (CAAX protease family)